MIRYQTVTGLNFQNSNGLPSIKRTEEGIAIGAIPGWAALFDPAYISGSQVRNRAIANTMSGTTDYTVATGKFANGALAFDAVGSNVLRIEPPTADVDPERWTVFLIAQDIAKNSAVTRSWIVRPQRSAQADQVSLAVGFSQVTGNTGRFIITTDSGDGVDAGDFGAYSRLSSKETNFNELTTGTPYLFIASFSVERGLTIRINGAENARAPDDRRPLTSATGKNDLQFFNGPEGIFGYTGLINLDITAPENAGHLYALETFLMSKYGVTSASASAQVQTINGLIQTTAGVDEI